MGSFSDWATCASLSSSEAYCNAHPSCTMCTVGSTNPACVDTNRTKAECKKNVEKCSEYDSETCTNHCPKSDPTCASTLLTKYGLTDAGKFETCVLSSGECMTSAALENVVCHKRETKSHCNRKKGCLWNSVCDLWEYEYEGAKEGGRCTEKCPALYKTKKSCESNGYNWNKYKKTPGKNSFGVCQSSKVTVKCSAYNGMPDICNKDKKCKFFPHGAQGTCVGADKKPVYECEDIMEGITKSSPRAKQNRKARQCRSHYSTHGGFACAYNVRTRKCSSYSCQKNDGRVSCNKAKKYQCSFNEKANLCMMKDEPLTKCSQFANVEKYCNEHYCSKMACSDLNTQFECNNAGTGDTSPCKWDQEKLCRARVCADVKTGKSSCEAFSYRTKKGVSVSCVYADKTCSGPCASLKQNACKKNSAQCSWDGSACQVKSGGDNVCIENGGVKACNKILAEGSNFEEKLEFCNAQVGLPASYDAEYPFRSDPEACTFENGRRYCILPSKLNE